MAFWRAGSMTGPAPISVPWITEMSMPRAASSWPRWAAEIGERVGYTPESILCVPLFYEDAVIGVLELLDKEGAPSFDEDDIRLLSLFANQAAIAIEQSRVQQSAGALVASVMRSVVTAGEATDIDEGLERDIRDFGASFEEDELFRRSLRLADLVHEISSAGELEAEAISLARRLADGPGFAHMMTKTMLVQEWSMGLEQAIEAEAQAQALCMQTQDFHRAYEAFAAKQKPAFEGD